MKDKKYIVILILLAISFLAYSDPLPLLLYKAEKTMSGWKTLEVTGSCKSHASGVMAEGIFEFTISRPKSVSVNNVEIETIALEKFLRVIALSNKKKQLVERLNIWGVNHNIMGLGTMNQEAYAIIGDSGNDVSKAQLWIEKFNHFPARLIYSKAGNTYDVRAFGWDKPGANKIFPKQIVVYKNGLKHSSYDLEKVRKKSGASGK